MKQFVIDIKDYSLDDFKYFLKSSPPVLLADRARERVIRSRQTLEDILARKGISIYGINTGLGQLSSVRIADEDVVLMAGKVVPAIRVLDRLGLAPLVLQAKEGLALINGSQVSTAVGLLAGVRLHNLVRVADVAGALSVDGLAGTPRPWPSRPRGGRPDGPVRRQPEGAPFNHRSRFTTGL